MMTKDDINTLRAKLDKSIVEGQDYSIIYNLSCQLDELIARYYKEMLK